MKLFQIIFLGLCAILLSSCGPALVSGTDAPTLPGDDPTPLASPQPSQTPAVHTLTVCAGSEPSELFLYNDFTYIKKVILSAIYDGPLDGVDFDYQPVILQKLPSLANGDAVIEPVEVEEGDLVMDNAGTLTVLQAGTLVRPAGCNSSDCAISYQNGTLQMDRLRVVFQIRPGVEWADGASLSAADSVFSYKVATDQSTLYSNNGLVSGSAQSLTFTAAYTATDDLTTEWIGRPGFLDANYQANFFIPLPEHQLSGYAIPLLSEANEVLYAPLGWGPYQLVNWEHGQQMTLVANPHYFRAAEGLPYFNTLMIRFIGQDVETNLAALAHGQCDILLQDALPEMPSTTMLDLVNGDVARLYLDPQPVFEHLTFNMVPSDPVLPAIFSNVLMRRAVAACIDRTELANVAYRGFVPPLDLPLPSGHPLMNGANLTSYLFDPAVGATLLDNLGWTDTDDDGIREAHDHATLSDGTRLQFTLTTTDSPLRTEVSALVAGQLRSCGMDVTVVQAPAHDLFAQNPEAIIAGRRFELAELSSPMGVEALCALAGTDTISSQANGWTGTNLGGYSDPVFDSVCADVWASLPGTQAFISSSQTALRIFNEDLPVLPLFFVSRFTLANFKLSGIVTGFGQVSELQNIENFRLEP